MSSSWWHYTQETAHIGRFLFSTAIFIVGEEERYRRTAYPVNVPFQNFHMRVWTIAGKIINEHPSPPTSIFEIVLNWKRLGYVIAERKLQTRKSGGFYHLHF
jgi:hypothetical protein